MPSCMAHPAKARQADLHGVADVDQPHGTAALTTSLKGVDVQVNGLPRPCSWNLTGRLLSHVGPRRP